MAKMDDLRKLGLDGWVSVLREFHNAIPNKITKDTPDVDFEFFWSGPYSQWHPVTYKVALPHPYLNMKVPVQFNCNEQFMMLGKALLFDDYKTARAIMTTHRPNEQKALGRKVVGFDDTRWREVAQDIVFIGNVARFSQVQKYRTMILSTKNKLLVEASPKDNIWGIGMDDSHTDVRNPSKWLGTNWLGICETETKEILQLCESDQAARERLHPLFAEIAGIK